MKNVVLLMSLISTGAHADYYPELCDLKVESIAYTAKYFGIAETSLTYTNGKIQILKMQHQTLAENPSIEYSLGLTREEVESELKMHQTKKNELEKSISEYKEDLKRKIEEAKVICK